MNKRLLILVLLWGTPLGCNGSLLGPDVDADIAILHAPDDSDAVKTRCAEGRDCVEIDVDDLSCDGSRADVVIVAGHSTPPVYLGLTADQLAAKIACLKPKVVVMDTCYGFSAPILHALAVRDVDAVVVGATAKLPPAGLTYADRFYDTASPAGIRADAVTARADQDVYRWQVDTAQIEAAIVEVDRLEFRPLVKRTVRRLPNLVTAQLDDEAVVLVEVAPERYR